ncbi:MAG: hypothetical protein KGM17_06995 [Sphingomonadales bacterium]|nr:hypothetical protein [Sphingomonadales bacterium]
MISLFVLQAAAATAMPASEWRSRAISGTRPVLAADMGYVLADVWSRAPARFLDISSVSLAPWSTTKAENPLVLRQPDWRGFVPKHMFILGGRSPSTNAGSAWVLQEVPPGTYAYLGYSLDYTTSADTPRTGCLCMGSIAFTVRPGVITVVGTFNKDFVAPAAAPVEGISVPAGRQEVAQFFLLERMPNWFGAYVDRIYPIEGLMTYRRDRMELLSPAPPTSSPAPSP